MELAVAAIEKGTVIDHIEAGKAFLLIKLFALDQHPAQITVGLNLPSSGMKRKDILKVTDWELTAEESAQIAVFSPRATINIIRDYRVVEKFPVALPASLPHLIFCPNSRCITHREETSRLFYVKQRRSEIQVQCHFCEQCFSHHEIKRYNL